MRLLLYYSVLHSLLYRQVFSQTFVFSEGKRKSRSRRAWCKNITSSSRISLRHSFLHPCKKLKQNTHYFHLPSWRLFVHASRSQNNECSVHLRLHHRENGGSFHLGRLAGEQNARYSVRKLGDRTNSSHDGC